VVEPRSLHSSQGLRSRGRLSSAGSGGFNARTSQRWLAARRSSLTRRAWKDACLDSLGAADAQRTGHIFRVILSAWRSGKADSGCCVGDLAMCSEGSYPICFVWVSEPNQPEVAPAGFLVGGDALLLARCGNNLGGAYHPGISPAVSWASGGLYIPRPCRWELVYRKALSAPSGHGVLCSNWAGQAPAKLVSEFMR